VADYNFCFMRRKQQSQSAATESRMVAAAGLLNDVSRTGDCKLLRQYIKKGYDCHARQSEPPHSSLLHLVARLECTDCDKSKLARTIMEKGVAVDIRDDESQTPVMLCAINGDESISTALVGAGGADVHATCDQHETALHHAAVNNNAGVVQLLLAAGASAAALCGDGALALHEACTHGDDCNLEMIKQLVSSGGPYLVDTNNKHPSGVSTPLLMAVSSGCSTEVAEFLIARGADVHATNILRSPVLMFASELSMVRMLLDHGAE
jgi:ankyrin repeat protein